MKKTCIIILFFIVCNCTNKKSQFGISFERKDFKKDTSLVAEIVDFKTPLWPVRYDIINDTLIFVTNKTGDPYYIEVYNLKTKRLITKIAKRGNGPNEFLACKLIHRTNNDNFILIHDIIKQTAAIYDVDSILKCGESYSSKQFRLPRFTDDIVNLDSNYFVGYNNNYVSDKRFNNNVNSLFLVDKNEHKETTIKSNYKYFTANVSGGRISISPKDHNLWVSYQSENRIDVFNNKLELIKTLFGPESFKPEYNLRNEAGYNDLNFGKRFYMSYLECFYTNSSVFMIYIGVNGIPNSQSYQKPVDILKFSWNGDLLNIYRLDRFIWSISIDKDEKLLYGISVIHSYDEYPQLLKYKLK